MTAQFLSSLPRLKGGWCVNSVLQRTAPGAGAAACEFADAQADDASALRPGLLAAGPDAPMLPADDGGPRDLR